MANVIARVPSIDDVQDDEELRTYFKFFRKLCNLLSHQLAMAAAQIQAMLKEYDRVAKTRRAWKVARPIGLAAGLMVYAARLLTLAGKRFDTLYEAEIGAERSRRRAQRSFRFRG